MSTRDLTFSVAGGLALAVAAILGYKTAVVNHPEFVPGSHLLLGLCACLVLIGISWLSRPRTLGFVCLAVPCLALASPTLLLFSKALLRSLGA